jgi:heat shock protein 4
VAEVKLARLFNETSAVALSYGIFRKAELSQTAKNVVFVDLGHSKLSVFCAAFYNDRCQILAEAHARNAGCRNIDFELLKTFAAMFQKKHGGDIMKNEKAKLRMLDAIERMRKTISANSEAPITLECLMDDEDFAAVYKREEFEALMAPMTLTIRQTFEQVRDLLKQKNITFSEVEIIGGGTRIPVVQKQIMEVFNVAQVMRTLNASECVATGCALMAAMKSPLFKVAEYKVEEYNLYPVKCSWNFKSQMEIEAESDKSTSSIIFPVGCNIPSIKSLAFPQKHGAFNLDFSYD